MLSFLFQVNCKQFCNSLLFKSLKKYIYCWSTVQGCTIRTQCHGKGKNASFFKTLTTFIMELFGGFWFLHTFHQVRRRVCIQKEIVRSLSTSSKDRLYTKYKWQAVYKMLMMITFIYFCTIWFPLEVESGLSDIRHYESPPFFMFYNF